MSTKNETPVAPAAATRKERPRLRALYDEQLQQQLLKELQLVNTHQVPKLEKIVLSMGVGEATRDNAVVQDAANELMQIAGQKPIITRARKSVSNFKVREGMQIGCKVTLRGARMYEFLERLICVALPRIRDFRGVSPKSFDGQGNFSFGLEDQLVFPEIDADKVKRPQGMNIAIITTARTNEHGKALLKAFGMPFAKVTTVD